MYEENEADIGPLDVTEETAITVARWRFLGRVVATVGTVVAAFFAALAAYYGALL